VPPIDWSSEGVWIHESSYVDEPCQIGAGTKIWHFAHILPGCVIGRDCVIGQSVMVGPSVRIADRCKIQNNVSLYKGVELECEVFCGPSCVFTNVINPRAGIERKDEFRPTLVKHGATIGANATILCGHTLGEFCMIGAGAVVTGDVPSYALVTGVPARRVGWMSRAGERLGGELVCPRDGSRYRIGDNGLLEPLDPICGDRANP
jgi:UDP-2-acetamido-3-amino-2,3-dideoxy-glucuronate N-acetyltransferase